MDAVTLLESRVTSLERSLKRSRAAAALFGLALLVAVAAAFQTAPATPASAQAQAQAQEVVRTQGLVLTNELDLDMVVLRADADGSLVVQTPGGSEIVRLGGPAARRIGH